MSLDIESVFRKEERSSVEREAVPLETALAIQTKLPFLMAPTRISEHIEAGHQELIDPLMERFMERYAFEWNALDAFCGDRTTSQEIIARFITDTYTDEDIKELVNYITGHRSNVPFFADDQAVDDFLGQFLH